MLLRKDQEARVVLGDNNSMEVVQGGGGGGGYGLENGLTDDQLGLESPIHPLGIKPLGNKLLSAGISDARDAIGAFQALPDGTETCYVLKAVVQSSTNSCIYRASHTTLGISRHNVSAAAGIC